MFDTICYYFLLFFIYSFLGWIIETIVCSYHEKKLILNRGFLIGPYIPIYGTAGVLMVLFLSEYKRDPVLLFCMAVIYSSLLEYVTSYLMEKIFKARWWDYSDHKFNLNGRICLENCLLFGVLGVILIYIINPGVTFVLDILPSVLFYTLAIVFLTLMITDAIITLTVLAQLNIKVNKYKGDATQKIEAEISKVLKKYRVLYKRMFKAFPTFRFTTDNGSEILKKVRESLDEVESYLNEKKEKIKEIRIKIKNLRRENANKDVIEKMKEEIKNIRKGR